MRDDVAMADIRLTLAATLPEVRLALARLERVLEGLHCCPDTMDAVQTTLAEVLNNIVEHAYAVPPGGGQSEAGQPGMIDISLCPAEDALLFTVSDRGAPMPGGVLPRGDLPPEGEVEDLPEGGFGWHLIRLLTEDLVYLRIGGENRLSFLVRRKQSGAI